MNNDINTWQDQHLGPSVTEVTSEKLESKPMTHRNQFIGLSMIL